jgi:hypothetical protein
MTPAPQLPSAIRVRASARQRRQASQAERYSTTMTCATPSNGSPSAEERSKFGSGTRSLKGQDQTLRIPWTPPSPYRRREIIQSEGEPSSITRPMRVRARAVLLEALRKARRWLDELMTDPNQTIGRIAAREGKSERSIRMTLSLAFVAPRIVAASIEGRLPRAGSASSAWWIYRWPGPSNGMRLGSRRPDDLPVCETVFCGLRPAGTLRRSTGLNPRNPHRRLHYARVSHCNDPGFSRPGNTTVVLDWMVE